MSESAVGVHIVAAAPPAATATETVAPAQGRRDGLSEDSSSSWAVPATDLSRTVDPPEPGRPGVRALQGRLGESERRRVSGQQRFARNAAESPVGRGQAWGRALSVGRAGSDPSESSRQPRPPASQMTTPAAGPKQQLLSRLRRQ